MNREQKEKKRRKRVADSYCTALRQTAKSDFFLW